MAIIAALNHVTHYRYDRPVTLGPQIIRLRPAPHCRAAIKSYSLKVTPAQHFVNWQQDPAGNWLARFVFPEPVREFRIEVDVVTELSVINPFDFFVETEAETFPFAYGQDLRDELAPYLVTEPAGPSLAAFLAELPQGPANTVNFIVDLNARLQRMIAYGIRMEPGVQDPEHTLRVRSGSCRDTSWLLVQALRHLGLAARFVSGYLVQMKADIDPIEGPRGTDKDFTDLHAWAEVYLPGAGWVGLDPTSGLLTGESHIPLAAAPHYRNAAPISGGYIGEARTEFDFAMEVERVAEHPRITKPFSDESWEALDALGHDVDRALQAQDVRLTMGGEPTFVSIDDFQSAEWNTDAVGPTKRDKADSLIRRLRERFAPGGFLHYGQGKWYPGESLPRWTFSLYWRKDGVPIWQSDALVAREATDYKVTEEDAGRLLTAIAGELDIPTDHVLPAFEDPAEWLVKEANLPENVDPANSKLENAEDRSRIARVFERGLTRPTGYVLPVQAWNARASGRRWASEKWTTRRGRIFLVPGDSPVGYRLPLSALAYIPPSQYPYINPQDPTVPREKLPDFHGHGGRPLQTAHFEPFSERQPQPGQIGGYAQDIDGHVRTALSVDISTAWETPAAHAARATDKVPRILLRAPSIGLASTSGTCL